MRLKVFQASSVGAAMMLVRTELGPDALILASREVDGGYEITAAHEAAAPEPGLPLVQVGLGQLRWHGTPEALGALLATDDLAANLTREFTFAALPCGYGGGPPLLLVGPPGAGKTTTTARLATRAKLAGDMPHVISADGRRAGAAEQLAAFTRLLDTTLLVADAPAQLARAMARRPQGAPAFVDMPGLNPTDPADRDYLHACREATGADIALVLPAGLDPTEAGEIAQSFREQGAAYLVATRLDQSRRLGGILAAAATGLALTDAGIGPGIVDGFTPLTPSLLIDRLTAPSVPSSPARTTPILALLARSRTEAPRTNS